MDSKYIAARFREAKASLSLDTEALARYDDIIDLPQPVPKNRARMSMIDRAAQFSPFAALSGYEEAVKERYRFFSFGDAMFIS